MRSMNIFDWVQRRLTANQQLVRDDHGIGRSVKKGDQRATTLTAGAGAGAGAKTLLQEQIDGRLGCWKDGILTIGTFGYEPLISQQQQPYSPGGKSHIEGIEDELGDKYGYPVNNNYNHNYHHSITIIARGKGEHVNNSNAECYDDNSEEEELNPLILPELLRGHNYIENDHCCHHHQDEIEDVTTVAIIRKEVADIRSSSRNINISDLKLLRGTKGERTTLADLFFADSAHLGTEKLEAKSSWKVINNYSSSGKKKKNDDHELEEEEEDDNDKEDEEGGGEASSGKIKKAKAHSFATKIIPQVPCGSRPIKKLHRLMRKMLKRKIHPELEQHPEARPEDAGARACDQVGVLANIRLMKVDGAADESVSLLRTNNGN